MKQFFSFKLFYVSLTENRSISSTKTSNSGAGKISVSRLPAHRSHLIHWANTESEFYVSRLTDGSPCPACRSEHPTSVFWQRLGWHCEDEKGL